jgi:type VI secretion system secreted protein VgrG
MHMQNIGLAKMVNVGAAYSLNVGGLMSTIVGAARKDVTMLNHSVEVGKSYSVKAQDVHESMVGEDTFIRMDSQGRIHIQGKGLLVDIDGPVQINGKDIDLN